jgi:hypothetical protein
MAECSHEARNLQVSNLEFTSKASTGTDFFKSDNSQNKTFLWSSYFPCPNDFASLDQKDITHESIEKVLQWNDYQNDLILKSKNWSYFQTIWF